MGWWYNMGQKKPEPEVTVLQSLHSAAGAAWSAITDFYVTCKKTGWYWSKSEGTVLLIGAGTEGRLGLYINTVATFIDPSIKHFYSIDSAYIPYSMTSPVPIWLNKGDIVGVMSWEDGGDFRVNGYVAGSYIAWVSIVEA
jgi:hypothetical protein